MRASVLTAIVVAGTAGAAGAGEPVFSNMTDPGSSGFNGLFPGHTTTLFDDARIVGGGELQDITFNMNYSGGFGAPPTIDMFADVSIALDDGDGVLQPEGETPLWEGSSETITLGQGEFGFTTVGIDPGIVVPDDATLWVGFEIRTTEDTFINFGTQLFDDFTIGSSDDNIYTFDFDSGNLSSLPNPGQGVGMGITVVPAPGAAIGLAMGALGVARRRRR